MSIRNHSVSVSISLLVCFNSHSQVGIFTIGDLPGDNTISHASDVSANGSVVIGNGVPAGGGTASFRWTADVGMIEIPGVPGGSFYESTNLSPSGNYVVGRYTRPGGGGTLSYIWSESAGTVPLGDLSGGAEYTLVSAVSDAGVAVGSSTIGVTSTGARLNRAAIWTMSGGIEALPLPHPNDENSQSTALDILADGRIFGQSASGSWLYSVDDGFEYLPVGSYLQNINSDASFMLGAKSVPGELFPLRATYWTPDTGEVELAPYSPDQNYGAGFMSDDGSIIIGSQQDVGLLVWIDQGSPVLFEDYVRSVGVDLDGWTITSVADISADGTTIVGTAYHEDWFSGGGPPVRLEAFVMTIPAPSTFLAFAAIGGLLSRRHRSIETTYPSSPNPRGRDDTLCHS